MRTIKILSFFMVCFLIVVFAFPFNAICEDKKVEKYKPDKALVDESFKKAKGMGYNPIPVYMVEEGGSIAITGGVKLTIRNGRQTFVENDMIINVGEFPIPVSDHNISKGEFAVMKAGKWVKQDGIISSD
jgi:hypothetical protein